MKIMNATRPKHYICLYRMGLIIFIKPFEVFDSKKSKSCGFPLRQVFLPPPSPTLPDMVALATDWPAHCKWVCFAMGISIIQCCCINGGLFKL